MTFEPPERFNIADFLLDARVREGRGSRVALATDQRTWSYRDVQDLANRFGNLLREAGVMPEQRVIISLPDGPEFVAALFGILKIGAVVVMVNPDLKLDAISYFYQYTRARVAIVHQDTQAAFEAARADAPLLAELVVVGRDATDRRLAAQSADLDTFPSHRDDACIWLFSGGTTGQPKAVLQSHWSFAHTTTCYGQGVLRLTEDDVTISVPKLFFGYAMGTNLFFPFSVGARAVLFADKVTPEVLFEQIRRHRPTVLVNVPTMVNHMVNHPAAGQADLSSLRLATSAGEALPVELWERWMAAFGVELLDGFGTAEMWHIFISARPGAVRPGTMGTVVAGFEVRVTDDDGNALPDGEVGWLRVRGKARAIAYWQQMEKTAQAFQGEWYVSGDMIRRDPDGYFTYCGRGDDMLKVGGRWLAPQEVENCLLQHPAVREAAVVGVLDANGLTKPHAFVVVGERRPGLDEELKAFVRERLQPYKAPREVVFLDDFPRTHLGKVDRGRLKTTETREGRR